MLQHIVTYPDNFERTRFLTDNLPVAKSFAEEATLSTLQATKFAEITDDYYGDQLPRLLVTDVLCRIYLCDRAIQGIEVVTLYRAWHERDAIDGATEREAIYIVQFTGLSTTHDYDDDIGTLDRTYCSQERRTHHKSYLAPLSDSILKYADQKEVFNYKIPTPEVKYNLLLRLKRDGTAFFTPQKVDSTPTLTHARDKLLQNGARYQTSSESSVPLLCFRNHSHPELSSSAHILLMGFINGRETSLSTRLSQLWSMRAERAQDRPRFLADDPNGSTVLQRVLSRRFEFIDDSRFSDPRRMLDDQEWPDEEPLLDDWRDTLSMIWPEFGSSDTMWPGVAKWKDLVKELHGMEAQSD